MPSIRLRFVPVSDSAHAQSASEITATCRAGAPAIARRRASWMPRHAFAAAPVSHEPYANGGDAREPRFPRRKSPQQRDQARRRRRVQSRARRPHAEPQHRLSHHGRQTEAEPDDQPGLGFAADSRQPCDPRSQAQQRQDERKPQGRGRAGCHQQRCRDACERGSRGEPPGWSGVVALGHRPREANPRRVGLLKPGDAHRPAADDHPPHEPNRMRTRHRRASQQQARDDRARPHTAPDRSASRIAPAWSARGDMRLACPRSCETRDHAGTAPPKGWRGRNRGVADLRSAACPASPPRPMP